MRQLESIKCIHQKVCLQIHQTRDRKNRPQKHLHYFFPSPVKDKVSQK